MFRNTLSPLTEFREAVAYAIYCVGLVEGLNTSLEALIYVYDGLIAELSSQVAFKRYHTLPTACTDLS